MVDQTDPNEQYGGADTGAQIQEALKNVGSLLARTAKAGAFVAEATARTGMKTTEELGKFMGGAAVKGAPALGTAVAKTIGPPILQSNVLQPLETLGIGPSSGLATGVNRVKPMFDMTSPLTEVPGEEILFGQNWYNKKYNPPPAPSVDTQAKFGIARLNAAQDTAKASFPERPKPETYPQAEWKKYTNDMFQYAGIDPAFANRLIRKESSGNPNKINEESDARGLYQFIPDTGDEFGLIKRDENGKIIQDDRTDPIKATDAFIRLTNRNNKRFRQIFGRAPTAEEMYMNHLMGPDGFKALTVEPQQLAFKALQNQLGMSEKKAFPRIWKNVPGNTEAERKELAENMTADAFIKYHMGAFSAIKPEYRLGGLVGPGGMPVRPDNAPPAGEPMRFGYTPPVDRPILPAERPMPQYQEPPMPQRPGAPGLTPPRFDFMERRFPSYQEGGMIGPGGMPVRPAGVTPQQAPTMASDQLESEIQRMMQQNPQAVQQIQQEIMSAMQTGELTPQELNMMVQLATLAAQNPQMYPQIRQFAIQQGIASEEDLGQEYDQGLVFTILLAARASQQQAQGGASPAMGQAPQVPQAAMQPPVASMMSGGALPQKSQNADGSVPIIAHEGEYVIPKEIVLQKGTDFFDKLIGKGPNASGNVR